ncbi:MAG: SDR family NAD(P)-dependent oxidoreductase [Dehalococcoidia bacterium]|jgi:3-oxoacyl-[acyl-carrier protein] reductase
MDLKLKGRVALVTGTGSRIGFGRAIALTLAEEGCDITSADIDLEGARKTAAEVEKRGRKAFAVGVDVSQRDSVDEMVAVVVKEFGRIDILINNAGTSSPVQPFMQMTQADWDIDIGVNLYGQMNVAQAVIPHMAKNKYGRIVNCSGGQGLPGISVYGAAKGGIDQFTHALAMEVAPMGIIVNAVLPGLGETGLVGTAPKEMLEGMRQMSALKRLCTPQDVADTTAFLASERCSYMAGQVIKLHTF